MNLRPPPHEGGKHSDCSIPLLSRRATDQYGGANPSVAKNLRGPIPSYESVCISKGVYIKVLISVRMQIDRRKAPAIGSEEMFRRYRSLPEEDADRFRERIGDIGDSYRRLGDLATFGGVFSMLMFWFFIELDHQWVVWIAYVTVMFLLFMLYNRLSMEYTDLYEHMYEERYGSSRI